MIEQGRLVFSGTVEEFDSYIVPNTLKVKMLAMPTVEELKAIPDLIRAEDLGGGNYRLYFPSAEEAMEQVVETSVARGWRLITQNLEKCSMDEIFAELSKKR